MKKLFLAAGFAIAASVAMGTTISITSGTADMAPQAPFNTLAGQFSLFGTGVSFTGAGNTSSGPCRGSFCTGITPIKVGAYLSNEDAGLAGTVILDGITTNYTLFPGAPTGGAGLGIDYTLPAFSTVGNPVTVTLTTGFTADAFFEMQGFNGDQPLIMNGGGIATINLSLVSPPPDGSPALYQLRSAHYEFVLVPEPGTAALMLIGLIGCSAIAFARRVKIRPSPRCASGFPV